MKQNYPNFIFIWTIEREKKKEKKKNDSYFSN